MNSDGDIIYIPENDTPPKKGGPWYELTPELEQMLRGMSRNERRLWLKERKKELRRIRRGATMTHDDRYEGGKG